MRILAGSAPDPAGHARRFWHKPPPLPSGRQVSRREIAVLVRFPAGPAGRYITGQTIHVNGGLFFGKS